MHTLTHSLNKFIFNTHVHTHAHTHRVRTPGRRATAVGGTVRERGRERISAVCRPYMESSPSRPIMIFVTNLPDTLQRSDIVSETESTCTWPAKLADRLHDSAESPQATSIAALI